ncbi:hypothetical protein GGI25_001527 [Coemansia spiralis]|uniref:BHLH domain-containing protein n=1 Tax=Coemansia spiralis TaxID=417178 RepID=A0A9W8GAD7_9FUNG|nr:hypothetical protein GGI25_001527 [Coemansia spiralis]
MDWTHLFVPNEDPGGNGSGSLDAGLLGTAVSSTGNPSLLAGPSDFFENLPFSSTSLPPRPPSIPADLEPAPLFSPDIRASSAFDNTFLSPHQTHSAQSANALGLQLDGDSTAFTSAQANPYHQQHRQSAQPAARPPEPTALSPPLDTLFDSKEESYLNSFLSSFDIDGLDIAPYLASPLPMVSFCSRTDFTGMGMGMGVGAGMMGAMDDAIPHLSLDDSRNDATPGLAHMVPTSSSSAALETHGHAASSMVPMRRQASIFDYGLGGTSHLSLGNVMSEEMQKVSSWLLQNQDHQTEAPLSQSATLSDMAAIAQRMSVDMQQQQQQQQQSHLPLHSTMTTISNFLNMAASPANISTPISSFHQPKRSQGIAIPGALSQGPQIAANNMWNYDFVGTSMQSPKPPSESDMSIKRKASFEQLGQPRKSRGHIRSPMRDPRLPIGSGIVTDEDIQSLLSHAPAVLQAASTGSIAARRTAVGANKKTQSGIKAGAATKYSTKDGSAPADFDAEANTPMAALDEDSTSPKSVKSGSSAKQKDSKKSAQRTVLTEEERRANHIASEQRRRNQIRQGYAELMTLVTTLNDPALGNHPGTAQSTPSKAVILAHAIQFIRGLEEGNRLLRKRLEGSRHILPPIRMPTHTLSPFHPHSPTPPHQ